MRDPRDTLHDSHALLDALSQTGTRGTITVRPLWTVPMPSEYGSPAQQWFRTARHVLLDDLPDLVVALERAREDAAFAREQADRWWCEAAALREQYAAAEVECYALQRELDAKDGALFEAKDRIRRLEASAGKVGVR